MKGCKKKYHGSIYNTNFKAKYITREKITTSYLVRGFTYQDDITILYLSSPNNSASNSIIQKQ